MLPRSTLVRARPLAADHWGHRVRVHAPAISVVAQPTYELGHTAADLLLARIVGQAFPPRHLVLNAQLVERASSRRPAG